MTLLNNENYNIEILHPKIMVFKNVFKNSLAIIKDFEKNSNEWTDWYTFGSHVPIHNSIDSFSTFPTEEEWNEKIISTQDNEYVKEFSSIFYNVTKKYYESVDVDCTNWIFDAADIAQYNAGAGISETRAMSYHTDYQQEKAPEPGNKFVTTCLFYLNDDYDDGELCFRVFNDNFAGLESEFEYKPSAGDVVVFPSTHPFYHGVKITNNGSKYLIRSYWKTWYDGDPEYLEEEAKHSKEEWELIKKQKYQKIWQETSQKFGMPMS